MVVSAFLLTSLLVPDSRIPSRLWEGGQYRCCHVHHMASQGLYSEMVSRPGGLVD